MVRKYLFFVNPSECNGTDEYNIRTFGVRHLIAVLLFFCEILVIGMRASISVAIVAMTDPNSVNSNFPVFDWDLKKRSYILSSYFWGALLTQIPVGYLVSNSAPGKFIALTFFLSGVANLATPLLASNGGWVAVVCCRVLLGLCHGWLQPCIYSVLSRWAPPTERARLGSFILNGGHLGIVLILPLTGIVAESKLGWPGIFYILGIISTAWAMLFWIMGADSPAKHPTICPREVNYIQSSLEMNICTENENLKFPWKSILKSVPVWALLITSCGGGWCGYIFFTELPSYINYALNFDIQETAILSALPYLVSWLLGFPFSWLSDFALQKGTPVSLIRKINNTIAMWIPALMLVVLCHVYTDNTNIHIIILMIMFGMHAGTSCGLTINYIDLTPNFSGPLSSIMSTVVTCCESLSPIVCGYLVKDMTDLNEWHVVFYLAALVYFFSNLVFLVFGSAEKQSWNDHRPEPRVQMTASRISIVSEEY